MVFEATKAGQARYTAFEAGPDKASYQATGRNYGQGLAERTGRGRALFQAGVERLLGGESGGRNSAGYIVTVDDLGIFPIQNRRVPF